MMKYIGWSLAAAVIGAACGQAAAESSGADVIVGELPNWISYGVEQIDITNGFGDRRPYAIGTLSCNRGDVPFSWRTGGNENRHPVIGQNLFRISQGRIEQIGQAWLKHGYTALQGNYGCAGSPGFPHPECYPFGFLGEYLGVGCSDPYDASLNGEQYALGPKWQVDAAHGLFPYPYDNPLDVEGSVPRRLNVKTAKFADTSAVYIAEGQYIGFDDAASGHDNNNASWRRATITNGPGYGLSLTDATVREQPAIYAWPVHAGGVNVPDSTITISPLDVPGDGRFLLGVRVQQLNATTWRYTYAVQNLNSHRSGRSLTVPFPGGTAISNVYFNQPFYHSGEPNQDQPDWSMTQTATSIAWSGPAHTGSLPVYVLEDNVFDPGHVLSFTPGTGNDHSANALRWGTMYTFGFDANVAPAQGSVAMALFRPGNAGEPGTVSWSVRTPGGVSLGVTPGNDACSSAYPITASTTAFSTAGASTDGPTACDGTQIPGDVWFVYTAECDGSVTINTCGSSFDTKLAVYPMGQCPPPQGSLIACNDDHAGGGCASISDSSVTFNVAKGSSYLVRVGAGHNTAAVGGGVLNVVSCPTTGACCMNDGTCVVTKPELCQGLFLALDTTCYPNNPCQPVIPGNDECANALPVCDGQAVFGSTFNADSDGTDGCDGGSSPSVWYTYTPNVSGPVTVSLCDQDTTYDTVVSIWSGACPGATAIGCNDDNCDMGEGTISSLTSELNAGTTYLIRVAGYGGNAGNFRLLVTGGGGMGCSLLPNDNCQGRSGIGTGTIPFTTVGATTDGPAHAACSTNSYAQIDNDIWYNFPLAVDGTLSVDTCGSNFDTRIAIYQTANALCSQINDASLVGCNDDSNACGNGSVQSALTVNTTSGNFYIIRVGGYEGQSGSGELHVSVQSGTAPGACCTGSVCTVVTAGACGGTFKGPGTTCAGGPGNPVTCCPANFNQVNGVTVQDIFDFLTAWLAGNTSADFNHVNGVTVQDIFDFLTAWLAGC